METQLNNLRKFLPAEVSGAYLAIQGILNSSNSALADSIALMAVIVAILAAVNVALYVKLYGVVSPILHGLVLIGFLIWVLNIDTTRFEDTPYIAPYLQLFAPISLVLYSLITSFVEFPKRNT